MALRRTTTLSCAHSATNAYLLHMYTKCVLLQGELHCLKNKNNSVSLSKQPGLFCDCVLLHTRVRLGIYSNPLANLFFLNMSTHTCCPLSSLMCHLESARHCKMYTASVRVTVGCSAPAIISKNN